MSPSWEVKGEGIFTKKNGLKWEWEDVRTSALWWATVLKEVKCVKEESASNNIYKINGFLIASVQVIRPKVCIVNRNWCI